MPATRPCARRAVAGVDVRLRGMAENAFKSNFFSPAAGAAGVREAPGVDARLRGVQANASRLSFLPAVVGGGEEEGEPSILIGSAERGVWEEGRSANLRCVSDCGSLAPNQIGGYDTAVIGSIKLLIRFRFKMDQMRRFVVGPCRFGTRPILSRTMPTGPTRASRILFGSAIYISVPFSRAVGRPVSIILCDRRFRVLLSLHLLSFHSSPTLACINPKPYMEQSGTDALKASRTLAAQFQSHVDIGKHGTKSRGADVIRGSQSVRSIRHLLFSEAKASVGHAGSLQQTFELDFVRLAPCEVLTFASLLTLRLTQ